MLAQMLRGSPYVAYSYAYPHKTAYRPLEPPVPLEQLWQDQQRQALFLYLHLPFCEMRCGFCNLFTLARPDGELMQAYLAAFRRQVEQVRAAVGEAEFVRLAIGGGTPTFLALPELATLLSLATQMGACPGRIPVSVEVSPGTVDAEKLALLREFGVDRLSIGVQSYQQQEVHAMGRPQSADVVVKALEQIRQFRFPVLNIDLIYGAAGQTVESWLDSVRQALEYRPEELYLYPLYVRPLTGLSRRGQSWDDLRLDCYRQGRQLLLDRGYRQVSMRMFRGPHAPQEAGPVYCCQQDGMVGLGCGARSYTSHLHYATEYAVGVRGVRRILLDYVARSDENFQTADYGFWLDEEDRRRRYVIQSLLQVEGLDLAAYQAAFATDVWSDLPELGQLSSHGWAQCRDDRLQLTAAGLERSDLIGPWLYSEKVNRRMDEYPLR